MVHRSVGTWTLDLSTRIWMKVSSDGSDEVESTACWLADSTGNAPLVGVAGGEGSAVAGGAPHWMTLMATLARWAGPARVSSPLPVLRMAF